MARLTIGTPATNANPTPVTNTAPVTPQVVNTAPVVTPNPVPPVTNTTPVVTNPAPILQPLDPEATLKTWLLARNSLLATAPFSQHKIYIQGVIPFLQRGYGPTSDPVAVWSSIAARGMFEINYAIFKQGTSGNNISPLANTYYKNPSNILTQFCASVIQSVGPSDPDVKSAVIACVNFFHTADSNAIYSLLLKHDWHTKIATMVKQ